MDKKLLEGFFHFLRQMSSHRRTKVDISDVFLTKSLFRIN